MFFQDPYLNEITCKVPFRYKTYRFQEIVILKQQNVKSNMNTSVWVKFIFNNSNMLEMEHSLVCVTLLLSFPAMDFISGQLISLTNLIHRIPGHFLNKPQILFCERAILRKTDSSNPRES